MLHAQERIESLEQELFAELRSSVAAQARRLKAVAQVTARMDVLSGLAETAAVEDYSRPEIHDDQLFPRTDEPKPRASGARASSTARSCWWKSSGAMIPVRAAAASSSADAV